VYGRATEKALPGGRGSHGLGYHDTDSRISSSQSGGSTSSCKRKPWFPERVICYLARSGRISDEEADQIRTVATPQAAKLGVQVMLVIPLGGTFLSGSPFLPTPFCAIGDLQGRVVVHLRDAKRDRARRSAVMLAPTLIIH
jgi:hypothetical protein